MTNDKTLPEDEAGEPTPADLSHDVEAEVVDIDGDEDVTPDAADERDPAHEPAGENLAVEPDSDETAVIVDDEAEELLDADETIDDTPDKGDPEDMVIDDEEQLAAAEKVAAKAKGSRPVKRSRTTAPVKKDQPTPKQSAAQKAVAEKKRTTPGQFVAQSVGELKKVIWPTGDQMRENFIVVLVFVLFIITFVSLLDYGFGWVLLKLLGAKQ